VRRNRRRRSDAPVGVFLSGGLDSTCVLAHLSEQVGPGVPAFSLGHADPEFDESRFATRGIRVLRPIELPPGDGGLAYGQAVLAAVSVARDTLPRQLPDPIQE